MRRALWPAAGHDGEVAAYFAGTIPGATFVAEGAAGGLAGFVEVGTRSYAEGCESRPVAYIEGWYVDPDARRSGVGTALIRAAETWARELGLREIASDVEPDNDASLQTHRALGYEEVGAIVCFRRVLDAD